jgi:GNAT superfamily N-acetyltransferase
MLTSESAKTGADFGFIVRRCQVGDEMALSLVGKATFLETYADRIEANDLMAYAETEHSVDCYRRWLKSDFAQIWVAETSVGHSTIGYIVALTSQNAGCRPAIEIKRLYLLHRFHRNGLGQLLLNEILATACQSGIFELLLRVQDLNQKAVHFYSHNGFRIVGEEPFRVGKRDYKAFIMQLTLRSEIAGPGEAISLRQCSYGPRNHSHAAVPKCVTP